MPNMATNARDIMLNAPPFIGFLVQGDTTVTHQHYRVAFYADNSVLIWTRYDGYIVLVPDTLPVDQRTIEHLARCLGLFSQHERAAMLGHSDKWVDGIHWAATGAFLGL
jgi:hypothetical protein